MLVEEVFLQIVLAGAQHKAFGERKVKCSPLLVQIDQCRRDHIEIAGAFETHQAAMAAAGIDFSIGHRMVSAG